MKRGEQFLHNMYGVFMVWVGRVWAEYFLSREECGVAFPRKGFVIRLWVPSGYDKKLIFVFGMSRGSFLEIFIARLIFL